MYTQEFFFYCFSLIIGENAFFIEGNAGETFLNKEKSEILCKKLVFFYQESEKNKFIAKVSRIIKKLDPSSEDNNNTNLEVVDIDKLLEFSLEEFFEMKKRNFKTLSKKFLKMCETTNGLLSYDDYKTILSEVADHDSSIEKHSYSNEILKLKSFLYSITSGKNKNDILHQNFNISVLKFGIDSPFPVIFSYKKSHQLPNKAKTLDKINENPVEINQDERKEDKNEDEKQSPFESEKKGVTKEKKIKIDSAIEYSALFGQHFSILRELKIYTGQFKEAISSENNQEVLMKHFHNICNIIEAACQFFLFPIKF